MSTVASCIAWRLSPSITNLNSVCARWSLSSGGCRVAVILFLFGIWLFERWTPMWTPSAANVKEKTTDCETAAFWGRLGVDHPTVYVLCSCATLHGLFG
jgi:hypothetical protein